MSSSTIRLYCAAASGTEPDDVDGLHQTMELDSLAGMWAALAQTCFLDFFFPPYRMDFMVYVVFAACLIDISLMLDYLTQTK